MRDKESLRLPSLISYNIIQNKPTVAYTKLLAAKILINLLCYVTSTCHGTYHE